MVCDGLKGLPEVVSNVWPEAIVQTCIIHLIRINTFRLTSRKYWDEIKRDVKPIYTAVNGAAARSALDELADKWGQRYPAVVRLWDNAWSEFIPFLDYDVEIRRVICSTNSIVIWSPTNSVLDVRHEVSGSPVLRGGRGYLQSSRKQSLRRDDARSAGYFTGLVA